LLLEAWSSFDAEAIEAETKLLSSISSSFALAVSTFAGRPLYRLSYATMFEYTSSWCYFFWNGSLASTGGVVCEFWVTWGTSDVLCALLLLVVESNKAFGSMESSNSCM